MKQIRDATDYENNSKLEKNVKFEAAAERFLRERNRFVTLEKLACEVETVWNFRGQAIPLESIVSLVDIR